MFSGLHVVSAQTPRYVPRDAAGDRVFRSRGVRVKAYVSDYTLRSFANSIHLLWSPTSSSHVHG